MSVEAVARVEARLARSRRAYERPGFSKKLGPSAQGRGNGVEGSSELADDQRPSLPDPRAGAGDCPFRSELHRDVMLTEMPSELRRFNTQTWLSSKPLRLVAGR